MSIDTGNTANVELALITNPDVGLRDADYPHLFFNVNTIKGSTLIMMDWEEAEEFLCKNDISSVKNLDGRVCIVQTENHITRVIEMFKP